MLILKLFGFIKMIVVLLLLIILKVKKIIFFGYFGLMRGMNFWYLKLLLFVSFMFNLMLFFILKVEIFDVRDDVFCL